MSGIDTHPHPASMRRRALTLAAAVVAVMLVSLLPAGSVASAADPAAVSRTAVVGIDFEPPCLNPLLDDCNVIWSHSIAGTALAGAFQVLPDFSLRASALWSCAP